MVACLDRASWQVALLGPVERVDDLDVRAHDQHEWNNGAEWNGDGVAHQNDIFQAGAGIRDRSVAFVVDRKSYVCSCGQRELDIGQAWQSYDRDYGHNQQADEASFLHELQGSNLQNVDQTVKSDQTFDPRWRDEKNAANKGYGLARGVWNCLIVVADREAKKGDKHDHQSKAVEHGQNLVRNETAQDPAEASWCCKNPKLTVK